MHISYEIDADVSLQERLRFAGLRPTRQRIALASLIFAKGDRHLSAEELHEEALGANVPVSLATVYNTLHQFTQAGMLRRPISTRMFPTIITFSSKAKMR
jgi:Fur family iron response transcriptional regulator